MASDVRHTLLFDGACPMCMRWMTRVRQWDRDGAFEFLPLQDPSVPERFPELDREDLEREIHLVAPDGETTAGAAAVERIIKLLPGGTIAGLLFHVPFARPIAERIYRWVAENRTRLGCGEHCGIDAAGERHA
jgi:predicted DCC family thiol-disulfide oxidoreductase YuxK